MKIKKLSEDIIFRKTTTKFKFLVGDKKVNVLLYEDSEGLDDDYVIEEEKGNELTEEEMELFTEDMISLYDMKENEELELLE